MTFYEAAVDILRREGTPLHFEEITRRALDRGLLSHVGRVPDQIMRARLLAMARREDAGDVAIVEPGVFGLLEWGLVQDQDAVESTEPPAREKTTPLRTLERTPMTLAEKKAAREAERTGRFEQEDREARTRSRGRRRRPKKDETCADALAAILVELGGGPIDLQYVVDSIPRQPALPEGFPRELGGLNELASAENSRRENAGESPRFVLEGDRCTLAPEPKKEAPPAAETVVSDAPRVEHYQAAVEQLQKALNSLKADKLEAVFLELARRHGILDAKVAKRSAKGSPLYTGMLKLGVAQMRVAVRMLTSGRDARADDVDEIREDLENYSGAIGVILTMGKVARAARSRAEDMNPKPVLLFDGEALSLACAKAELGVRLRLEQVAYADPSMLEKLETTNGRPGRK